MRFRDKVALISGAGSGTGRATAQMIGAEGGPVVGVDLDQAAVEQIMDGICRAGGTAHALVANAPEAADVARVVQQTVETCSRIDILVNTVGGSTIICYREGWHHRLHSEALVRARPLRHHL